MNVKATSQERIYSAIRRLVRRLELETSRSKRRQGYDWLRKFYLSDLASDELKEGKHHRLPTLQILVEVARVACDELRLDTASILALLFFKPVVEEGLSANLYEQTFGSESLRLLRLLARTSELYLRKESISSENFHNLLLSMAEDIRVVLLIIADRLYRLRHAKYFYDEPDRVSLAIEISFLYAPIAHRLGLYAIKGEMEDLCLKYRDRKTFDFIKRKLGETKHDRDAYIDRFVAPLRAELEATLDVPFEIKGRVKSISSIHNKLRKQNFEDIYDLFAIRVILDVPQQRERQACWQVYSIVTDMYRPNPERLKDWISIPKSNGYESLHITVMGPDNKWVEVQIRTRRMDAIAEQGVAAHWRYKGLKSEGGLDQFLASVRETLEAVRDQGASEEKRAILESSMMTLKAEEIYVFTPKGEVLKLPKGATVLDFAFYIHSRLGASTISGKVNGKNVSIKYQLQNGDSVEVLTSPQQSPKQDWLSIVVSQKARNRIRQILRAEEEAGLSVAKEMIQRRIKNRKLPWNEALFIRLTVKRGYKALTDFYRDITHDRLDAQSFLDQYELELKSQEQLQRETAQSITPITADHFVDLSDDEQQQSRTIRNEDILVIDQGLSGVEYSFAKCCQPVYGDPIFGFVSSKGIKIHRVDCPNAPDMIERTGHRVLCARWSGGDGTAEIYNIEVVGRDDIAVVTNVISLIKKETRVKLRSYSIDSADGLFRGSFVLFVHQREGMSSLIKKIRDAVGVKQVERL